ncbi:AAA family ATPase [uncultured Methanoregula sp.]|uniref:AAA family ATPase n=1 Tax=uncultured Methanoregula sp. TaxID=1005933 RepID=UPI002AAAEE0B|nr:AAA family ATPase [uncultured Methanoregula sp.]
MPIHHIHVENFKSFSEIDIDLSGFNVVIGSNAAGKSNFISVFKFLRDIARYGIANAIAMQGGAEYLRNAKIGYEKDLVIRVDYTPDQKLEIVERPGHEPSLLGLRSCASFYEFSLRFQESGDNFTITKDRLVIGCEVSACERDGNALRETSPFGNGELVVSSENGEVRYTSRIPEGCCLTENEIVPAMFRGKHLPEKTLLLETIYGYPLPHVEKFFDRIAVYDIDPKLPKRGVAITGKRELDEDAGNLALVIRNIIEDPEKKRKLSNLLRDVLPFVEDFSVRKFMDVSLILTLRERYTKSKDLPAASLSDGTIAIFAMIIALYFEDKPFIIIEEPVSHIHPFLVARLMTMMKEASEKKQVMITTHSTEVVKHAVISDILLISRDNMGFSVISRPGDKEEVKTFLENEIGIEELYVQNLLGL